MAGPHNCHWVIVKGSKRLMECNICRTVSNIEAIIANTAKEAAKAERIAIYVEQLRGHHLMKKYRDQVYVWVVKNTKQLDIPIVGTAQTELPL